VRLFGLSDLHVDYAANLETVKHLQRPAGEGHLALIIAGDVTADRGTLREALAALRETLI
jgi:predicted phosphodiesterase